MIADIMAANKWQRGKTGVELGREWGVATSTVESYAVEASRLLDLTADASRLTERYLLDQLADVIESAESDTAKVQAIALALKQRGMMPEQRSRLTVEADLRVSAAPPRDVMRAALEDPEYRALAVDALRDAGYVISGPADAAGLPGAGDRGRGEGEGEGEG